MFTQVPLIQALKSISLRKNPGTYCFYLLLGLVALLLIAKISLPGVRHQFMRQFHLTSPSFAQWAGFQFVPSMYSFGNEFWYSTRAIEESDLTQEPSAQVVHGWLNHYPLRVITFSSYRHYLNVANASDFITVRSSYAGDALTSQYSIQEKDKGFEMSLIREFWLP